VAKYKKKRARELQHDRFRDTTMSFLDRLGDLLEGRGRTILYGLGGLILAVLLVVFFVKWNNRKNDEARQALGRAINITTAAGQH
jgi:type II secretory pathway component PulM